MLFGILESPVELKVYTFWGAYELSFLALDPLSWKLDV